MKIVEIELSGNPVIKYVGHFGGDNVFIENLDPANSIQFGNSPVAPNNMGQLNAAQSIVFTAVNDLWANNGNPVKIRLYV